MTSTISGNPELGPIRARSSLDHILEINKPLPREALFLGVAVEDELPVLLNLRDPVPGPLLVLGDSNEEMTNYLQVVAGAVGKMHTTQQLEYGVITIHPDEWDKSSKENRVNVFGTESRDAEIFLHSLRLWGKSRLEKTAPEEAVVLFFDGLENALSMSIEAQASLIWLLTEGPKQKIWPIVTLNPQKLNEARSWLKFFQTRLFGHIKNSNVAERVTGLQGITFERLGPHEMVMREQGEWLRFVVPNKE